MKNVFFFVLLVVILSCSSKEKQPEAPTVWEGSLKVDALEMKLIFNLTESGCLLNIPALAIQDFPSTKYKISRDSINIIFPELQAQFSGINQNDTLIVGNWVQLNKAYPINLKKKKAYKRIQNPQPPFPYNAEEISYFNRDKSIKFGGTLTTPSEGTKHPVVILISGSGQQDRDETVFGHKPFLVIADYLTRQGIAVLRVDDRGIGQTTGKKTIANATSRDFAMDVIAGIEYLKSRNDINDKQIGLIGHSEGGLIATIVGATRNDVSFIVSLAGVGVSGEKLFLSQIEKSLQRSLYRPSIDTIMVLEEQALDIIKSEKGNRFAEVTILQKLTGKRLSNQDSVVKTFYGMRMVDGLEIFDLRSSSLRYKRMMLPWYRYLLSYKPEVYLSKIKAPFLALNGEKDAQVIADLNLNGIKNAFDRIGKSNYKVISYADLNHFFQHCNTCYYEEIDSIEETISPEVLYNITAWIKEQI